MARAALCSATILLLAVAVFASVSSASHPLAAAEATTNHAITKEKSNLLPVLNDHDKEEMEEAKAGEQRGSATEKITSSATKYTFDYVKYFKCDALARRCICRPRPERVCKIYPMGESAWRNGTPLAGRYEKRRNDQIMIRQVGNMEHNLQKYNDLQNQNELDRDECTPLLHSPTFS
ncbi:serine-aspartate repeat-containing protein C-like [Panicum miliaceum]|uniref:Serine-aspartate repeat-containing protein C-like n=1 Tax=Panicum miliaceum TaxID=4540 RepID=A0A3L6R9Y2_PANMI|nr:serine-aspartate repeat-containing protein C-like [Panicum miliaceum]